MKSAIQVCQCDSKRCQERLLNQDEVAELLKVSPKTLEYWRWKGGGPEFVKIGKLARYKESAVQAYIEQLSK